MESPVIFPWCILSYILNLGYKQGYTERVPIRSYISLNKAIKNP
jgi:hypothetical protein